MPSSSSSHRDVRRCIGVDVGGTKILAVVLDVPEDGRAPEVVERELIASQAASPAVLEDIGSIVGTLMARSDRPIDAVGVGLAGFIDSEGVMRKAPNVPALVGVDVGAVLAARTGLPVSVDNDANCVAVAADALLPEPSQCLVAVTFGTGIGGGIVIGGELVRGANGFAGEPGHMVIELNGHPCKCGQRGCWEQYASGSGLARLAREACAAGRAPGVLAAAGGSLDAIRGEHVTDLLDSGDAGAVETFTQYAGYVALGFANLRVLLDPHVIVMGGGLSAHGDRLLRLVDEVTRERFPSAAVGRFRGVVVSPGGPEAGAIGAGLLGARQLR